ncbi:PQQ-dependent sugar dehydrogenase [Streptomyces marincola]|uniref:Glucose/Sorbosone dehydrogenase domain-containing protein n=1 Tax=Streptomyces marincola TaxID=2878388 RepID=A0A1W7CX53_9ACTN|nr:PQQ-dependent sugar dehydrogenase [Streptomyces marincola]ARQ69352.1 hypothetical protein CAG99_11140 [Streptomyces marincola]
MRGWHVAGRVAALAVTGALVVGCAVGPAADRARQEAPPALPAPTDVPTPPVPGDGTPGETAPGPSPAPATGDATETGTEATDLGTACCVAGLPDSDDLLVGAGDTVLLHDADAPGELAEVGTVPGRLLGLAVPPRATGSYVNVVAYYAGPAGGEIASFRFYPDRAWQSWGGTPVPLLDDPIPLADDGERSGGVLAFGPDGMLYAGTGDAGDPALAADEASLAGKILRIDPNGSQPPVIHSPGAYTDVRGLAWDGDRMWAVDAVDGGGARLYSVVPEGQPVPVWEEPGAAPAGLAAARGSLWMPAGEDDGTLWRVPLNGGTGLVADPQPVLDVRGPRGIFPAPGDGVLRLLAGDALTRLGVR